MSDFALNLLTVNVEEEMRSSYLDYSMSVIIGRALPDVRDGLKPVHRRILYAMFQEGMLSNRRYSKCAGVVGEVLKKYHPHGDSAVYDALVRMAQPWNMRQPLVDGQGNFGSVDGDAAAAYRYTECKMTRLAEELLADIEKETVPFVPNFDGSHEEPAVLPAAFPNLLVNGSDGIAVGMATKIPPHNLAEVIDACVYMLDNPDADLEDIVKLLPGPDFPTAAAIYGREGIRDAYRTGRGRIVIRGNALIEEDKSGRQSIIIDELPFQVNKARLVEEIATLVKQKRIEGVSELRDESDRHGMRVVIEIKKDAIAEIVLNKLYKHTALQSTFGVIMLAIVGGRPLVLNLQEMIFHYLAHRRTVTTRRTQFELRQALARAHILEGYRIALDRLDAVIALIRSNRTVEDARAGLIEQFALTGLQAQAILDLRLQRLTGMEREKIEEEYAALLLRIGELEAILADPALLTTLIRTELLAIKDRFGEARRTRVLDAEGELSMEDLVAEENQIITLSHAGYIKRTPAAAYEVQGRGGMGRKAMETREEDFVRDLFVGNTHSLLLVFTNRGRMLKLQVYELPEAGRAARGKPIVQLLPLDPAEKVTSVLVVRSLEDVGDLVFCSRKGLVKRTPLSAYSNIRTTGIMACTIAEDDELIVVRFDSSNADILMTTRLGMAIRFRGEQIRPMGRIAQGNKGIELRAGDEAVDLELVEDDPELHLLTVTTQGFGKRTPISEYRLQNRSGLGLIDIKVGERNGDVMGAVQIHGNDRVMLATDSGRAIQMPVSEIRVVGRNTMGVRLMRIEEGESVVALARVVDQPSNEHPPIGEETTPGPEDELRRTESEGAQPEKDFASDEEFLEDDTDELPIDEDGPARFEDDSDGET
jgi:DNA gyrase subunit A